MVALGDILFGGKIATDVGGALLRNKQAGEINKAAAGVAAGSMDRSAEGFDERLAAERRRMAEEFAAQMGALGKRKAIQQNVGDIRADQQGLFDTLVGAEREAQAGFQGGADAAFERARLGIETNAYDPTERMAASRAGVQPAYPTNTSIGGDRATDADIAAKAGTARGEMLTESDARARLSAYDDVGATITGAQRTLGDDLAGLRLKASTSRAALPFELDEPRTRLAGARQDAGADLSNVTADLNDRLNLAGLERDTVVTPSLRREGLENQLDSARRADAEGAGGGAGMAAGALGLVGKGLDVLSSERGMQIAQRIGDATGLFGPPAPPAISPGSMLLADGSIVYGSPAAAGGVGGALTTGGAGTNFSLMSGGAGPGADLLGAGIAGGSGTAAGGGAGAFTAIPGVNGGMVAGGGSVVSGGGGSTALAGGAAADVLGAGAATAAPATFGQWAATAAPPMAAVLALALAGRASNKQGPAASGWRLGAANGRAVERVLGADNTRRDVAKASQDRHIGVLNATLDELGGQIVDNLDGSVASTEGGWSYQLSGDQMYPAENQDDALLQYVMGNVINGRIRVADPMGFRNRLAANLAAVPLPDDRQFHEADAIEAERRLLQNQGQFGGGGPM